MAEPLADALARVRGLLLDDTRLVKAVAAGRQRGAEPRWRRAELRYVDLAAGRRLQVVTFDATQSFTANHDASEAPAAVGELLAEPFGNWHVHTPTEHLQLRVTKKREALVHTAAVTAGEGPAPDRAHDRSKTRLLPDGDPVLAALGITDASGRVKPSRQAKLRQVEELLRALDAALEAAWTAGSLRRPTEDDPLRLVDLGCGNAYLTFAAQRYLGHVRGLPVHVVGVDVKQQSLDHNTALARTLGLADRATFVQGAIGEADLAPLGGHRPDVVLALHACDTATDDALAQAVRWEAPLVLAAPCCHHDVAAQLRRTPAPAPYSSLVRDGILRERFADTLTDALRAVTLRGEGYRVEVMEFVESRHTPRNTLLRGVRTGAGGADARAEASRELEELTRTWQVRPRLRELLG